MNDREIQKEILTMVTPMLWMLIAFFLFLIYLNLWCLLLLPLVYWFCLRMKQLSIHIADRILSVEHGYYPVQNYLHQHLSEDHPVSKLHLFFLRYTNTHPFYSCRIALLRHWKHRKNRMLKTIEKEVQKYD